MCSWGLCHILARIYPSVQVFTKELWPRNEYTEELESGEGWGLHVYFDDDGADVMTWHLRKEVYEQAARDGGMKGKLEWRREVLPGEEWKKAYGLRGEEEWKVKEKNPHLGILIVCRD